MTSNKVNKILIQFPPQIIKMLGTRSSLEQKRLRQPEIGGQQKAAHTSCPNPSSSVHCLSFSLLRSDDDPVI